MPYFLWKLKFLENLEIDEEFELISNLKLVCELHKELSYTTLQTHFNRKGHNVYRCPKTRVIVYRSKMITRQSIKNKQDG